MSAPHDARQGGFTYIGVLLFIAMLSAVMGVAGTVWSTASRRDREAELLFVGDQIRQAVVEFRDTVPSGQQARFPRSFDELLLDKRFPTVRRHLRKVYLDPITGAADWVLIPAPGGGFAGVHSPSLQRPIKESDFPRDDVDFDGAKSYAEWIFAYPDVGPGGSSPGPATTFKLPAFGNTPPGGASPMSSDPATLKPGPP